MDKNIERQKQELIKKGNYCKDIPNRFSDSDDKYRDFLKGIYKYVDTSKLDHGIENYDFDKKGDQEYHKIMGKKFLTGRDLDRDYEEYPDFVGDFYPEYGLGALDKMAHQVHADCYIELNRLLHGEDKDGEAEMKRIATNGTKSTLLRKFEEKTTEEERNRLLELLQDKANEKTQAEVEDSVNFVNF